MGFLVISALVKFQSSLKDKFGSNLANFHLLITLSQFHLIFSELCCSHQQQTRFSRMAEDSTRPAFDTILSVVNSFNSISTMFESTYFALHSSFRAVLSVVEQMTRLRAQFSHILSAFATLRLIRAVLNRIRGIDPGLDEEWSRNEDQRNVVANNNQGVKWPILVYTGLTVAAPFLMWKLVSSFVVDEDEQCIQDLSINNFEIHHFRAFKTWDLDFNFRGLSRISI